MSILNKKRSADEGIGKLIMFAIVIIVAVGLVGVIMYFYNINRIHHVNTSVLGYNASGAEQISHVQDKSGTTNLCPNAIGIRQDPINQVYYLLNSTGIEPATCIQNVSGVTLKTVGGNIGYTIK